MPFRVFRIPASERARLERVLGDDVLSRQSITVRDSRHFGLPGDHIFLFVEGSEAGMTRAEALVLPFGERAPDHGAMHRRLKAEEDEAAEGLGSIFPE